MTNMTKKTTLNLIDKYHEEVKNLYEESSKLQNEVIEHITDALNSKVFSENYAEKSEFSDFEIEVFRLLEKISKSATESHITETYIKALKSYKSILMHLEKD